MKKKNNAGFSIVEVLIALAIFTILMMPIVKSLIQSLKMSTSSKELQYRNEFAEVLMEHVKAGDIEDLEDVDFYNNIGATITNTPKRTPGTEKHTVKVSNPDGSEVMKDLETASYEIKGTVDLGSTKKTTYNFLVDVDNEEYAKLYEDGKIASDINNKSLGIVESLDYRNENVALIDNQIFNYDSEATVALRAKKLQELKLVNEELYRKEMEGESNEFSTHEGTRMVTIKVSGSKKDGYLVQCILNYCDDNYLTGNDRFVEYNVYGKQFDDALPNIYMMYNPSFYNGNYQLDDYISVDVSDLKFDSTAPEKINLFVIETATTYSNDVWNSGVITGTTKDKKLFHDKEIAGEYRNSRSKIHMIGVLGEANTGLLENINVYTNITDNYEYRYVDNKLQKVKKINLKTEKGKFDTDSYDMTARDFVKYQKVQSGSSSMYAYSLTGNTDEGDGNAKVKFLHESQDDFYGLYNVKVYLKKQSDGDIDVTKDIPILQGTKGGSES